MFKDTKHKDILRAIVPFLPYPCQIVLRPVTAVIGGKINSGVETVYNLLLNNRTSTPEHSIVALERFLIGLRDDGVSIAVDYFSASIDKKDIELSQLQEKIDKLEQDVTELNKRLLESMFDNPNVLLLEGPKDSKKDGPIADDELNELLGNLPKKPGGPEK